MRKSIAFVVVLLFSVPASGDASPRQRELIVQLLATFDATSAVVDERDRELLKAVELQAAVREALIDVYASRFSEAELAELLAFYKTPAGAKLARLAPELLRESVEKSRAALAPLIERERDRLSPWVGTVASMRLLAEALEKYAVDNAEYPQTSFAGLKRALVPRYLDALPEKDSWGNDFYYAATRYGRHYRIVSAGADGIFEAGSQEIPDEGDQYEETTLTDDLKMDIVYANGSFMRMPRVAVEPE